MFLLFIILPLFCENDSVKCLKEKFESLFFVFFLFDWFWFSPSIIKSFFIVLLLFSLFSLSSLSTSSFSLLFELLFDWLLFSLSSLLLDVLTFFVSDLFNFMCKTFKYIFPIFIISPWLNIWYLCLSFIKFSIVDPLYKK